MSRSEGPSRQEAASRPRSRWRLAVLATAGGVLLVLLVLAGVLTSVLLSTGWPRLPDPPPEARVRLYAGDAEIAVFQGPSRHMQLWVPLADIPPVVVDAVLIAEDRRFFRHAGVDLSAVARAAWANLRQGRVAQGASTLTQQLARTLYLKQERTLSRKLREVVLAAALELRYDKPAILEAYLNAVYMGHDGGLPVYGLPAAARQFLRKDLGAVRLDEAAMLAAAINAPNKMLADRMRASARRNAVLEAMAEQGRASRTAVRSAQGRPTHWRPAARKAPYFVDLTREEIARRVALPARGEVRLATSLDPALQEAAEAALEKGLARIERRRGQRVGTAQGALVAIEPATGRIRALVGGRRYAESAFNRATRAARQPGSLFKPLVYLAAFESGLAARYTPASVVADAPLDMRTPEGVWSPGNASGRFAGPVTIRRALEESLNLPAIRVASEVGPARVAAVARAAGIESALAPVPSLALGTSEVTLLEITAAYATLANEGRRVEPTTLALGPGDLALAPPLAPAPGVSAESAFLITHLLRGVMRSGTGRSSAQWGLSEVTAGKTGTTDGLRDAWFVGYTPDLVVGVWVGHDDGTPLGLTGAQAALPIWAGVMQVAVRRRPPRAFAAPEGVVFANVNRETGQVASFWCGDGGPVIQEAFRAGTEPSSSCQGSPFQRIGSEVLGWVTNLFRRTQAAVPR
jgi:penicillin-binding protein 1B